MTLFSYKAIGADGAMVSGTLEADDINSAFASLSAKGLNIIDVGKADAVTAFLKRTLSPRKLKRTDVIEFSTNLGVMLKAGIPIVTALQDLHDSLDSKGLRDIVGDMKNQIESGTRFSDAMELHQDMFPGILVRLARVGEETGRLDKSLADVADHLQKMEDLSQSIKRAMTYPMFAIVTTTGALIFWLAYVLPKIMESIKGMGVKMPFITIMLLHISEFTQAYWFLIPLTPVLAVLTVKILKRNEKSRYFIDELKIRMPIIKLIVHNKLLALFSEQMRILVMSGITIDRCLGIVADVMGNEVFKKTALNLKESVSAGNTIADSLKPHKEFPQLVIRMVALGETSGQLEEQFGFLSGYYLKKLDDVSEKLGKIVEPLVITVIGVLFAIIVIGLMLPIYDLVSHFGKM
ncbi:MAG: type II secretion system F family protein [Nitrospirae bacterium]|nr:type II secretion system F family protein [Nitrospirota bacterium]